MDREKLREEEKSQDCADIQYLSDEDLKHVSDQIIKEFGGINGIRNEALLESALINPFQTFTGQDLYPTILNKAIQLCYAIIKNHPFLDGNKRTGLHSLLILLNINGWKIDIAHDESIDIIFNVADGSFNRQKFLLLLKEKIKED